MNMTRTLIRSDFGMESERKPKKKAREDTTGSDWMIQLLNHQDFQLRTRHARQEDRGLGGEENAV